jgi:hypothetical protein
MRFYCGQVKFLFTTVLLLVMLFFGNFITHVIFMTVMYSVPGGSVRTEDNDKANNVEYRMLC